MGVGKEGRRRYLHTTSSYYDCELILQLLLAKD